MAFRIGFIDPSTPMNGRHRLLLGRSKHLVLDDHDRVRYRERENPRAKTHYRPLSRVLVVDTQTDCLYGEIHLRLTAPTILSVLGRAWHAKEQHPMRGLPNILELAKPTSSNHLGPVYRHLHALGISTAPLPGGFAAGVHVYKQFDNRVKEVLFNANVSKLELTFFQTVSAALTERINWWPGSHEAWANTSPPPQHFYDSLQRIVTGNLFDPPFQYVATTLPS